jgi:large subunit ribosomal protein L25
MAGERIKLQVKERESLGSRDARRLRKQGLIPGVLYGRNKQPHAFAVPERELRRVLSGAGGLHTILDVELDEANSVPSILKDYQQDALRGRVIHVDLQEVRLDRPIQASVVVELVGGEEAPGVREGGVLSQVAREINVEALPMEVPERIELDVSGMELNATFRLVDLPAREGVTYLDDPEETVLATVTMPTRVEEPEAVTEEGEEGELEGVPEEQRPEGGAEGDAAPSADAGSGGAGEPGSVSG